MSVKIRLRRMGAKKKPFYRLVVADARSPRDGRFIEAVGIYDPLASPALVKIDAERVKDWISKGARPTDVARQLLVSEGLLERTGKTYDKIEDRPKPSRKAQAKAAAAAEAPPEKPAEAGPAEAAPADATPAEATPAEAPPADAADSVPAAEASTPPPGASEPAVEKSTPEDAEPSSPASETELEPAAPVEQHAEAPAEGSPETGEAKK